MTKVKLNANSMECNDSVEIENSKIQNVKKEKEMSFVYKSPKERNGFERSCEKSF